MKQPYPDLFAAPPTFSAAVEQLGEECGLRKQESSSDKFPGLEKHDYSFIDERLAAKSEPVQIVRLTQG